MAHLTARLGLLSAAALLAACAAPGTTVPSSPAASASAAEACAALARAVMPAPTELSTRHVAAGTRRAGDKPTGQPLGGHCVVKGRIDPRIGVGGRPFATGFELSLPDDWNGRLLYLGGGGNDGRVRDTTLSSSIDHRLRDDHLRLREAANVDAPVHAGLADADGHADVDVGGARGGSGHQSTQSTQGQPCGQGHGPTGSRAVQACRKQVERWGLALLHSGSPRVLVCIQRHPGTAGWPAHKRLRLFT